MKGSAQLLSRLVLMTVLLLTVQAGCPNFSFSASEDPVALTEPVTASNVDALLAGLSDEQVRQLFIEELRKEAEAAAPSATAGTGPVAALGRLLAVMDSTADGSSGRLLLLWNHVPQVLPEVRNVLAPLFADGAWSGVITLLLVLLISYGVEQLFHRLF